MENLNDIGTRIREIRQKLNINQAEFGRLIGVSNKTVSAYENGDAIPFLSGLVKIAKIGDASIEWLIMGKETTLKKLEQILTDEERRLLEAYRQAGQDDQLAILRVAENAAAIAVKK